MGVRSAVMQSTVDLAVAGFSSGWRTNLLAEARNCQRPRVAGYQLHGESRGELRNNSLEVRPLRIRDAVGPPFDLRLLHPHSTTGIDVDGPPNHLSIPG